MTEPTDTTIKPEDFGEVFDNWIAGATLSQKSIEIYGNPGLFAEYEKLERELKLAEAEGKSEEASMADSRAADIEEKMVDLYEKWQASKSTWTLRGVPPQIAAELADKYPDEEEPTLAKDADDAAKKAHKQAMAAYDANVDGRNYSILEQAVLKIVFADGRTLEAQMDPEDDLRIAKPAVTAAQLATLRKRLGVVQYMKLIGASMLAATNEPVIPAPFSRSSSKPDQT